MSHGETPEAKARRKVAERLASLLGASSARDAADSLGGTPAEIDGNGERLALAIEQSRKPAHRPHPVADADAHLAYLMRLAMEAIDGHAATVLAHGRTLLSRQDRAAIELRMRERMSQAAQVYACDVDLAGER